MDAKLLGYNKHTEERHKELILGKNEKEEVICNLQYTAKNSYENIIPITAASKQHRNTDISYFSSASVDLKKQIVVSST